MLLAYLVHAKQVQQEPWDIHFFAQRTRDGKSPKVPAQDFLNQCPDSVRQKFFAVIKAVADAPPPQFSGGGKWEAMRGDMKGFYEIRVDGPKREHYRLFCLLEREGQAVGLGGPSIVLIDGRSKAFRTKINDREYLAIKKLGEEFRSHIPRSVLR